MFSRSDLDELVAVNAQPAVSLYLPTHRAGREVRQDPIRLRNLLSRATERLGARWCRPEIEHLLEPGEGLVGDDVFWRHQLEGLVVFLAPAFSRIHKLPIPVPEECGVGDHFLVRPLLPLLEDPGSFWLLSISGKRTRLYRGSRWEFVEEKGVELPQGVGKIREMTLYQETQYASPVGRRGTFAHAQSFGETPQELRKSELIELLRRIAAMIEPRLKANPAAADPCRPSRGSGSLPGDRRMEGDKPRWDFRKPGRYDRGRTASPCLCAGRAETGRVPPRGRRSPQRIFFRREGDDQAG